MKQTLRRVVTINNPNGLHMRPAAAFAELASRYDSSVTVARNDVSVDGKNWVELLLLTAEQGTELRLEVSGRDAAAAIEALATALGAEAVEENQPAAPPA